VVQCKTSIHSVVLGESLGRFVLEWSLFGEKTSHKILLSGLKENTGPDGWDYQEQKHSEKNTKNALCGIQSWSCAEMRWSRLEEPWCVCAVQRTRPSSESVNPVHSWGMCLDHKLLHAWLWFIHLVSGECLVIFNESFFVCLFSSSQFEENSD